MSLKDAMMKAGLKSSKTQNMRDEVVKRDKKKIEKHQETRNFCEVCELIQPDVERYKHKNPTVDAEWICSACADREEIHDDFRVTHQSEFATKGRFRREFGATKDFNENKNGRKKSHHRSSKAKPKAPREAQFNLDEDGEKNFNC